MTLNQRSRRFTFTVLGPNLNGVNNFTNLVVDLVSFMSYFQPVVLVVIEVSSCVYEDVCLDDSPSRNGRRRLRRPPVRWGRPPDPETGDVHDRQF